MTSRVSAAPVFALVPAAHDNRVHPVGFAVQRALMSYSGGADAPDLARLRERVNAAWSTWQESPYRYTEISEVLPVSSTGALTATTAYDAWGNPETTGGLTAVTPFGIAGGYTDPTGLTYLLHRYYDPQAAQFASLDPLLSSTLQPYAYAADDPVSQIDPTGEFEENPAECFLGSDYPHLRKSGNYQTVGYKAKVKCAIPVRKIEITSQMCKLEWEGLRCKPQGDPATVTVENKNELIQKNLKVTCVNSEQTSWAGTSHAKYRYGNKWYPGTIAPPAKSLACGTPG